LFVMRKGITPTWEDSKNRSGGAFSFKVYKTSLPSGRNCVICCAGSRWSATARYKNVNGISIRLKKFLYYKNMDGGCEIQDPKLFPH
jgi:hypothetical protein